MSVVVALWLMLNLPLGVDTWLDLSEPPVPADAIICIGGGTADTNLPIDEGWNRIYTTVQLFADGYAPLVAFTGRGSTTLSEAEIYAEAAAWLGVPRSATLLDPLPLNTAQHPSSVLESAGGRLTRESRILLVTSRVHSRRVLRTFQKQGFAHVRVVSVYRAVRAEGMVGPAGPVARHAQVSSFARFEPDSRSYADPFNTLKWRSADLLNALREVTALAWYWARGFV
jgi:uncharacterized SAM-binding protein YcdF (DUF218 family)